MNTFVVRLWTAAKETEGGASAAVMRGTVERVGWESALPFGDAGALLEILRAELEAEGQDRRSQQ